VIAARAIATVAATVLAGSVSHLALVMRLPTFDNPQSEARPIAEPELFRLGSSPGVGADRHNRSNRIWRSTIT